MKHGLPSLTDARVTAQISGGLGNQLFQYAMARRLSLKCGVPLFLDRISGFQRDFYRRQFQLDHFNIQCQFADVRDSYPGQLGRLRRKIQRRLNINRAMEKRFYIHEEHHAFLRDVLTLHVTRPVYLEGMWQRDQYFADIRPQLLADFTMRTAHDEINIELAGKMQTVNAVCVHVRRLHGVPNMANAAPLATNPAQHIAPSYYTHAMELLSQTVSNPQFFVFADFPDWARENIHSPHPVEFVCHNGASKDYEDFWLMTRCRHFIIANSTFSWWAAWLGQSPGTSVIAPRNAIGAALVEVPQGWILAE